MIKACPKSCPKRATNEQPEDRLQGDYKSEQISQYIQEMRLILALLVVFVSLAFVSSFAPKVFSNIRLSSSLKMAIGGAADDEFALLQKKIAARVAAEKSAPKKAEVKKVEAKKPEVKKAEVKKVEAAKPVVKKVEAPKAVVKPVAAPKPVAIPAVKPVVAAKPVAAPAAKPVAAVKPVASVAVQQSSSSGISGAETAAGIALGVAPYLLIPALLLSSAKNLIKKPKPLPVPAAAKSKVAPYSKPLGAGVKEGLDELLSGKKTEDLELTRKGLKFAVGGFALGGVFLALLSLGGAKPEAVKEVKATPAAKVAPAPAKAPAAVIAPVKAPELVKTPEPVKAPAPAPVAVKAPEPVKVAAPVAVKAPEPVKVAEPVKAPAPAPVAVKAPEPVKVAAPAPVAVKAPEPVKAPTPAPVKAPAPTTAAPEVITYNVPKGMEADKVDLDALKALRVSNLSLINCLYLTIYT